MGELNFLVEGGTCAGKTAVCDELNRRGYRAIHGDRELAYQGDPVTGEPTDTASHEHHIWDVERVRSLVVDRSERATSSAAAPATSGSLSTPSTASSCSRSTPTPCKSGSTSGRPTSGDRRPQRALVLRLHESQQDIPAGVAIDATAPVAHVVDDILRRAGLS